VRHSELSRGRQPIDEDQSHSCVPDQNFESRNLSS
jgi:hypothetical protein